MIGTGSAVVRRQHVQQQQWIDVGGLARDCWSALHVLLAGSMAVCLAAGATLLAGWFSPVGLVAAGWLALWPAFAALVRTVALLVLRVEVSFGTWLDQLRRWPRDLLTGAPGAVAGILLLVALGVVQTHPGLLSRIALGSCITDALLVLMWQLTMAATDHRQQRWRAMAAHSYRVLLRAPAGVTAALGVLVAGSAAVVQLSPTLLLLVPAPAALVLTLGVWAGTATGPAAAQDANQERNR